MDKDSQKTFLTLPSAIIFSAAIIAIAIIWVKRPASVTPTTENGEKQTQEAQTDIALPPVTSSDHIFGNPNAQIKIVEYSDASCSYCKKFNPTMIDIINQYGPSGKVAWIYRHFPLDKPDMNGNILHPNAGREAQAMECAASIGGNDKFWAYEKALYATTSSATNSLSQLPVIAKSIGLDVNAFNKCLDSGQFKDKVDAQSSAGEKAGVGATPTSFFVLDKAVGSTTVNYVLSTIAQYNIPPELLYIGPNKKIIVMGGAIPKEIVSGLIDTLIK